jgi:iron complex outermembrane recepter protein
VASLQSAKPLCRTGCFTKFLFFMLHSTFSRYKSHFLLFSSVFSIFLFAQSARAQDSTAQAPPTLLPTALIQATRVSTRSPVPHNNLRAADLEKGPMALDMPYLLAGLPSVVESSDAGAGIGYTGIRIRGSDPTRINVTLNGIPLNDAESQGVFWVNLPDLASSAAEVQVQRGVGSSTNGAGAFGASINVDLSKVAAEPFATLSGTAGSFGTLKSSVHLGTGTLPRGFNVSGRFSGIASDGFIDRARADLRSMHLQGGWTGELQAVQVHLLDGKERTYQAWNGVPVQYAGDSELRRYNSAGTERMGTPYEDEVDDYRQRHLLAHYKWIVSARWSAQANAHYTRGKGFFEQYKHDQTPENYGLSQWDSTATESDLVRRRWLDNHFGGGSVSLKWSPDDKGSVLFGAAASQYAGKHFGEVIWAEYAAKAPKDLRYYDNDALKYDWNGFVKAEHRLGGSATASLDVQLRGVQYEFLGFNNALQQVDQEANYLFFNPKAGLHYQVDKHWNASLFSGIGQREPNRDDFTQSTPDNRPKSEHLWDTEASLHFQNTDIALSVTAYTMRYRDQLVLDGRLNDVGAYIRTNVDRSFRNGIELEGKFWLSKNLLLNSNLSLSRNRIRQFDEYRDNWDTGGQDLIEHRGSDLAFSPGILGRAEADYTVVQRKNTAFSVNFAWKYVGKQYLDNSGETEAALPAYHYADLRLHLSVKNMVARELVFVFQVQNLFDHQYASNGWIYRYRSAGYDARPDDPYARLEGGDRYNQTGLFTQAGRNWLLTCRMSF